MERDDNIIKIAKDMDGKGLFTLSNRFAEIIDEASRIENEEQSNNFNKKLKEFMLDLKLADSGLHDRVVKTSGRWSDFWKNKKKQWDQGRIDKSREKGENELMQETEKKRKEDELQEVIQNKKTNFNQKINEALQSNGVIQAIDGIKNNLEKFHTTLNQFITDEGQNAVYQTLTSSMSAIQSSYASVEKAKNDIIQQYKDSPGTAKYVERIMKPLLNALMATKKTLDEAETSNKTVEGAVKNLSQINTTYNDMMTGLNNAQTADSSNTGGKAENIPVNEVKPIKLTPRGRISKKEQAAIDEISKRPENKGLTPRQLREIYRKEQANVEGDATTAPTGDSQTSPSSPNNAVNQPVNVPSKEAQAFYEEFFKLNPTATEDQALSAFLAKRTNQPGKP